MSNRAKYILTGSILLISNRIYNFTLIPNRIYQGMILLTLIIILFLLLEYHKKGHIRYLFKKEVRLLIFFPVVSIISAVLFHNQSIIYSFAALLFIYFWSFYFLIHKLDLKPERLISLLTTFGIIWALILIIQQFTFPHLLFIREDSFSANDFIEQSRYGIIRVTIMGVNLCVFSAIYFWSQIITKKFKLKNWIYFAITLLALILTGSRQIIGSMLFVILFSMLYVNKVTSVRSLRILVISMLIGIVIFAVGGGFFDYLIKLSEKQGVGSDRFQRIIELKFFLFDYWPKTNKWFAYFFGNGWEFPASTYGNEINNILRDTRMLSRSDIGLFGAINKGGLLYFFVSLIVYYKLLVKYKVSKKYRFIKLFFIQSLLTAWTGKIFFEYLPTLTLLIIIIYLFEYANQDFINNSNPQPY